MGRPVCNPVALRRWIRAYAAAVSTTASFETIRDAATNGQRGKPVKSTTTAYRDILERLWIIDPVPAWLPTRNHLAALAVAPKHQLADPALAARLVVAVEVKMGAVVTDENVRHLHWLRAQLGDAELLDAIVISTGARAYRRSDGIGIIPATLLGPQVPRLR